MELWPDDAPFEDERQRLRFADETPHEGLVDLAEQVGAEAHLDHLQRRGRGATGARGDGCEGRRVRGATRARDSAGQWRREKGSGGEGSGGEGRGGEGEACGDEARAVKTKVAKARAVEEMAVEAMAVEARLGHAS